MSNATSIIRSIRKLRIKDRQRHKRIRWMEKHAMEFVSTDVSLTFRKVKLSSSKLIQWIEYI